MPTHHPTKNSPATLLLTASTWRLLNSSAASSPKEKASLSVDGPAEPTWTVVVATSSGGVYAKAGCRERH